MGMLPLNSFASLDSGYLRQMGRPSSDFNWGSSITEDERLHRTLAEELNFLYMHFYFSEYFLLSIIPTVN